MPSLSIYGVHMHTFTQIHRYLKNKPKTMKLFLE